VITQRNGGIHSKYTILIQACRSCIIFSMVPIVCLYEFYNIVLVNKVMQNCVIRK
jgi:hypothetical protein